MNDHCDDPMWDGTDAACPAYFRGEYRGGQRVLDLVEQAIRGEKWGTIGDKRCEQLMETVQDLAKRSEGESVYCGMCGACGEEGCCPKTRCKYGVNYSIQALETLRGLIENEKNVMSYKIQGHNDRVRMTDKDYYRANGEICGLLAAMIIIDKEIERIRKGEEL